MPRWALLLGGVLLLVCAAQALPPTRLPHPTTARRRTRLPNRAGATPRGPRHDNANDERKVLEPPIAKKIPHTVSWWGDNFVDNYAYMRNRTPDVLEYLQQEEAYSKSVTRSQKPLQDELYTQLADQIAYWPEELPISMGDYVYFYNYTGDNYAKWYRFPKGNESATVLILNENKYAGDAKYFYIGVFAPTRDGRYLAFNYDIVGDESYTLIIRDLETMKDTDHINGTFYGVAWSYDSSVLFYNTQSKLAQGLEVWRHVRGQKSNDDVLVYSETDATFEVHVSGTNDGEFVLVNLFGLATTEVLYLSSRNPYANLTVFYLRRAGVSYFVDHTPGTFVVMTNADGDYNYRLVEVEDHDHTAERRTLWQHSPTAMVLRFELYSMYTALFTIEATKYQVAIIPLDVPTPQWLPLPESVCLLQSLTFPWGFYTVYGKWETQIDIYYPYRHVGTNDTEVSYVITSLISPDTYYTYNVTSGVTTKRQQMVVPSYNEELYAEERVWVHAPDGMRVPSTYIYLKDKPLKAQSPQPMLLYAYGAYGDAVGPTFSALNLLLVDRGIVYGEVLPRGSSYRGALWYTEGRVLHKRRTFDDFIATAEFMVQTQRTLPSMLGFNGRSAGGLLMGAVLTQRPDLCVVVWAGVPFVDALNTMSDPSITYVVYEYPEWGNPLANRLFYENMLSYDPYWNVKPVAYPNLLVQTGLADLLVNYWEPTKLVAKLRATRANQDTEILLHVLDAGHEGYSGDDGLRDSAFQYGFVITCLFEGRNKGPHPRTPAYRMRLGSRGVATIVLLATCLLIGISRGLGSCTLSSIHLWLHRALAFVWKRDACGVQSEIRARFPFHKQELLPMPVSTSEISLASQETFANGARDEQQGTLPTPWPLPGRRYTKRELVQNLEGYFGMAAPKESTWFFGPREQPQFCT